MVKGRGGQIREAFLEVCDSRSMCVRVHSTRADVEVVMCSTVEEEADRIIGHWVVRLT